MSNYSFNCRWAEVIVESLVRHGMRNMCIAPGSRSTPLTLAATKHDKLTCHTHFDERGLGYLALGLAKSRSGVVGVIVTSGTAVANLYPALIEAGLTGERLVFLTADRPPELIDCGANQAIQQQGIFASHPTRTLSLPRPTSDISASWLLSAIDSEMNQLHQGVFHLNCPFADPLYGEDDHDFSWLNTLGTWWSSSEPWLQETIQTVCSPVENWPFWRKKRGIVIAGRLTALEGVQVAQWAEKLGWPLISDVLSQTGQSLPHADLWLNNAALRDSLSDAELIVQFCGNLTGKRVMDWQAESQSQDYWLISPINGRLDPVCHRGRKFTCSVQAWLDAHKAELNIPWCETLNYRIDAIHQHIASHFASHSQPISEAALAYFVHELLPPDGQIFIGNSLSIRLIDALGRLPTGYPVYSNRGASGIDGLISTAAGIARGTKKATLAMMGDLSALYDLNSLALLRETPQPMVLIVVNNQGGQIFSLLPTAESIRQDYYCMPQSVDFYHAATMFGLHYLSPKTIYELITQITQCWRSSTKSTLIELQVNSDQGAKMLQTLLKEIAVL